MGVPSVVSDRRLRAVDYSVTVDMEQQVLMYRRPIFEADVSGFVKPYALNVSIFRIERKEEYTERSAGDYNGPTKSL